MIARDAVCEWEMNGVMCVGMLSEWEAKHIPFWVWMIGVENFVARGGW
jgi:hypothetical protein